MPVAFVNSASASVTTATTNVVTYSSTVGNQLVCVVTSSAAVVTSITDSAGNAWVRMARFSNTDIWTTVSPTAAAVTSVTVNQSSATTEAIVGEYSGVAQVTASVATATASSTNPTISFTLTAANNWLVAGLNISNNAAAPTALTGNLRKSQASSTTRNASLVDNTAASAISVTDAVTHANSAWGMVAIELKPLATPLPTTSIRTTNANSGGIQSLLAGGTAVKITASSGTGGFQTGATVTFDGNAATSVVVVDGDTITCVNPARGSTGFVNIVVTNTNTLAGTLVNGWQYCKIAYVGGAPCTGSTGPLTINYPISGANPIFVVSGAGCTLSDDGGNGYHRIVTGLTSTTPQIWMSNSLTPHAATAITVTVAGNFDAVCVEYEGVVFAEPQITRTTGSNASPTDTMTLTAADNVMLTAFGATDLVSNVATSGNKRQIHLDVNGVGAQTSAYDNTATTAIALTNSCTISGAHAWSAISIELHYSASTLYLETLLVNGGVNSSNTVYTTPSIGGLTPGSLLLFTVYNQNSGNTLLDYPLITGNGVTWNQLIQFQRATSINYSLFWAIVPVGVTDGAFTVTYSKTQLRSIWVLDQIVGGPDISSTISWCVQAFIAKIAGVAPPFVLTPPSALQDANSMVYFAEWEQIGANWTFPATYRGYPNSFVSGAIMQAYAAINGGAISLGGTGTPTSEGFSLEITKSNSNLALNPLRSHQAANMSAQ